MKDRLIAGRFQLERLLGRGGMSEVWLARDRELDREVAVKLHDARADRARLVREARAGARLSHPNVAQILDYGAFEGQPYLVLEYLPGGTLEDRLAAGEPLPDDEGERIARDIAAGLAHAHQHGLVHRDLKPSNIVFDVEERAKIADFGIARACGQTTLTDAGTLLGTAAYMSPEQAAGEPVTPASDVYAFGTILFRILTGQLPFGAETPLELALKHRSEPVPPIESRRADAPPALSSLAAAALAKEPSARPSAAALLAALDGKPAPAPLATAQTLPLGAARPARTRGRRVARLLVLALLALAGMAIGVLGFGGANQAPGTPASTPAPTQDGGAKGAKARSTTSSDRISPLDQTAPGAPTPAKTTTEPTTAEPTSTTTEPEVTEAEETSSADTSPAETSTVVTEPPAEGTTAPPP